MHSSIKVLLLSVCLVSNTVLADVRSYTGSCTGGTKKVANNIEFCLSGQVMNWLSALTWCEADGGKLAEYESVCPDGNCLVMKNYTSSKTFGYINRISGSSINRIELKDGLLQNTAPNRPVGYDYENAGSDYNKKAVTDIYAFCEPK